MQMFCVPRGAGKTTALVKWAASPPPGVTRVIVVASDHSVDYIRSLCHSMRIPDGVVRAASVRAVLQGALNGLHDVELGVDDINDVVRGLLRTPFRVMTATASPDPPNRYANQQTPLSLQKMSAQLLAQMQGTVTLDTLKDLLGDKFEFPPTEDELSACIEELKEIVGIENGEGHDH